MSQSVMTIWRKVAVHQRGVRNLYELLFALNLSFAVSHVVYKNKINSDLIRIAGMRIEHRMNDLFEIPTIDVYHGYFMLWVPSILAAPIFWMVLRGLRGVPRTRRVLPRLTGFVIVLIPSVVHVFFGPDLISNRSYAIELVALCSILGCSLVVLFCRWNAPMKVSIPSFALLFGLWWRLSAPLDWPGYDGPTGPILGFCAAAAWVVYVTHRSQPMPASGGSSPRASLAPMREL